MGSCADDYRVAVPAGFPNLPVPAGNLLTESRVELGKRLFYDKLVSGTGEVACTSCHLSDNASPLVEVNSSGGTANVPPGRRA